MSQILWKKLHHQSKTKTYAGSTQAVSSAPLDTVACLLCTVMICLWRVCLLHPWSRGFQADRDWLKCQASRIGVEAAKLCRMHSFLKGCYSLVKPFFWRSIYFSSVLKLPKNCGVEGEKRILCCSESSRLIDELLSVDLAKTLKLLARLRRGLRSRCCGNQ